MEAKKPSMEPRKEWRRNLIPHNQGNSMELLRATLLQSLGAVYWHEITVGHSWQQYRALDMYIRTEVKGMAPREEEAWYLLMSHGQKQARIVPSAAAWYDMPVMLAWGHRCDWKRSMYFMWSLGFYLNQRF